MAVQFIPQVSPYTTENQLGIQLTETKTPEGGTAYQDPSGNKYTRTTSGFQLFQPLEQKSVLTTTPIMQEIQGAEQKLQSIAPYSNIQSQLGQYQTQATQLEGKVTTLVDAEKAGMQITPQTTVQQAEEFLRTRSGQLPTTTVEPERPLFSAESLSPEMRSLWEKQAASIDEYGKTLKETERILSARTSSLDAQHKLLVSGIQSRFTAEIEEQKKFNEQVLAGQTRVGVRMGTARYAPGIEMDRLNKVTFEGVKRIQGLEQQRDSLIAQAQVAHEKEQYEQLYRTMSLVDSNQDKINNAVIQLQNQFFKFADIVDQKRRTNLSELQEEGKIRSQDIGLLGGYMASQFTGNREEDLAVAKRLEAETGYDYRLLLGKAQEFVEKKGGEQFADIEKFKFYQSLAPEARTQYEQFLSLGKTTAPSFQITTGPTGEQQVFNKRTGQVTPGGGTMPLGTEIPPQIKAGISKIDQYQYFDESKLTSRQIALAQQLSTQLGIPFVDSGGAKELKKADAEFRSANQLLTTIEGLSKKVITAKVAGKLPEQILRTQLGALSRTNEDARVFLSSTKAFSSLLTRAAGEKGVLTNLDVQRIINALPNETDTIGIAQKKVANLRRLYESQKRGVIGAYLGVEAEPAVTTTVDRVRVKSRTGQVGTIPRSQLNAALGQGYIQL